MFSTFLHVSGRYVAFDAVSEGENVQNFPYIFSSIHPAAAATVTIASNDAANTPPTTTPNVAYYHLLPPSTTGALQRALVPPQNRLPLLSATSTLPRPQLLLPRTPEITLRVIATTVHCCHIVRPVITPAYATSGAPSDSFLKASHCRRRINRPV